MGELWNGNNGWSGNASKQGLWVNCRARGQGRVGWWGAELISVRWWTAIWTEAGSCPTGTPSVGPLSWMSYGLPRRQDSGRQYLTLRSKHRTAAEAFVAWWLQMKKTTWMRAGEGRSKVKVSYVLKKMNPFVTLSHLHFSINWWNFRRRAKTACSFSDGCCFSTYLLGV